MQVQCRVDGCRAFASLRRNIGDSPAIAHQEIVNRPQFEGCLLELRREPAMAIADMNFVPLTRLQIDGGLHVRAPVHNARTVSTVCAQCHILRLNASLFLAEICRTPIVRHGLSPSSIPMRPFALVIARAGFGVQPDAPGRPHNTCKAPAIPPLGALQRRSEGWVFSV